MVQIVKIYAVDSVETGLVQANPPTLVVCAVARASSTGWHSPQLARRTYVVPPPDGIEDFDFLAMPPAEGDIVAPVLAPIVAQFKIDGVDIGNYWGLNTPLKGTRVHAETNTKLSVFAAGPGMPGLAAYSTVPPDGEPKPAPPGFAADIRRLFRVSDVNCMIAVSGFNLHDYDDVKSRGQAILGRLENGSMPMDGPWPPADIELFKLWVTSGMAA